MNASKRSRTLIPHLFGLSALTILLGVALLPRERRFLGGAPVELSAATKMELERLVAQHAPDDTPVSSLVPASVVPSSEDLQVQGLAFVKLGMTNDQALALLGAPTRLKSTVMADGIYGVPERMENKIGFGNRFEMWSYEQAIPSQTVYATVWFCPDSSASGGQMRVVDVTTIVVKRSLQFRLLQWVEQRIPALRLDD